jgi:hypothetical protein
MPTYGNLCANFWYHLRRPASISRNVVQGKEGGFVGHTPFRPPDQEDRAAGCPRLHQGRIEDRWVTNRQDIVKRAWMSGFSIMI